MQYKNLVQVLSRPQALPPPPAMTPAVQASERSSSPGSLPPKEDIEKAVPRMSLSHQSRLPTHHTAHISES